MITFLNNRQFSMLGLILLFKGPLLYNYEVDSLSMHTDFQQWYVCVHLCVSFH